MRMLVYCRQMMLPPNEINVSMCVYARPSTDSLLFSKVRYCPALAFILMEGSHRDIKIKTGMPCMCCRSRMHAA